MDHIYGIYGGVDAESAALILQLQRDDVESLMTCNKGKGREDELSDIDLALQLQLQELRFMDAYHVDRRMSRSHAFAINRDGKLLQTEVWMEEQASRDRELARRLNEAPDSNITSMRQTLQACEDETMVRLEAKFDHIVFDDFVKIKSADMATASSSSSGNQTPKECVVCMDDKQWYDVLKLPCGDDYCATCLTTVFEGSITDESLYPPRCCRQIIPLESARAILHPKLVETFREKSIELDSKDRTYCFAPACFRFIPDVYIEDDVATCPGCGKRTCTTCKAAAHTGDCPQNETLRQLLDVAEAEGWQRCYVCRRVIELQHGCNHMTCPCGAEFCYVCGAAWKPRSCDCPQWDELRLEARARQIADRPRDPRHRLYQPPQGTLDPVDTAQPAANGLLPRQANNDAIPQLNDGWVIPPLEIQNIMRDLEENHECEHGTWKYISGSHRCEECDQRLPQYIFQCRQCHIRACWRCRRNRL